MKLYNKDKLHILLFQHKMYDLELGYYEVLDSDDFCIELTQYLKRLLTLGRRDIITNILKKVGVCTADHKRQELRAKAFGVIAEFTELLGGKKDRELFHVVATIITGWLRNERKPHSAQNSLFLQIVSITKKMFSLQLWHQSEPMVAMSKRISLGDIPADRLVQEEVSKLHQSIADKDAIQTIVKCFIETRDPHKAPVGDLLLALTPHSLEAMIHSLFKCGKKNIRLALLEMIPQENEGVLPILIEKLKDRQPWYVVRNSMTLLGALGDADLYPFAKPFLNHPDVRVQREVIICIASLGGSEAPHRLIAAFPQVSDEVKPLIVEQLQPYSGLHIDTLFIDILEQRIQFKPNVREELINSVCSSGKLQFSERSIAILHSIEEERAFTDSGNAQALDLVRTTIKNM